MSLRVIVVRKDGQGDFRTIGEAVASVGDSGPDAPVEIVIHPGVYEERSIRLKPHMSLRGTDRETCVIRGELPSSSTDRQLSPVSTVDWNTSGRLKDLTITCRNMRYPVHSDGGAKGNKDGRQELVNCRLEHFGNRDVAAWRAANNQPPGELWSSQHAWGCGTSDGMEVYARDCTFVSPTSAFYFHENIAFDKPSYVELRNCRMIATNPDETGRAIWVQGYGSGRNGKLVVNGCEIVGYTDIKVASFLPVPDAPAYFRRSECTLVGGGNTASPVYVETDCQTLRVTSRASGEDSRVRVDGSAAAALFAEPLCYDGAEGIRGYAEGGVDVAGDGIYTKQTSLGHRLGDRRADPWTLSVSIDGRAPVSIRWDKDYTETDNEAILDLLRAALGPAADVCTVGVDLDYYPEYADQNLHLYNTTGEGILKGMAVAHHASFKDCRKMTDRDAADDFVGIALGDIRPGELGRILTRGIVFDAPGGKAEGNGRHGIRQETREPSSLGMRFGISKTPGCFRAGAEPAVARGAGPGLVKFEGK